MTQEPKHPHDRKKRHSNWGGRRTGARPGNMNALKHGRRSAHMGKSRHDLRNQPQNPRHAPRPR